MIIIEFQVIDKETCTHIRVCLLTLWKSSQPTCNSLFWKMPQTHHRHKNHVETSATLHQVPLWVGSIMDEDSQLEMQKADTSPGQKRR